MKNSRLRVAALAASFLASPLAASAAPWFGQTLPPPVNDPTVAVVQTVGTAIPAQPATFAPGPKSPLLNGPTIKEDVKTIVGFSLQSKASGDYLWGRVTGTKAYYDTVSWAVDQLKAAGLKDAHLEDFTTTLSIPTAGEVRIVGDAGYGDGTQDVVLQSAMIGGDGPVNGTATAPMIFVGHGSDADLIGRDVKGKIAVLHSMVNPGIWGVDEIGRPAKLIKLGAAGVIEILDQLGNLQSFDNDRHGCGTAFCATVGGGDGFFLESVIGKAAADGKTISAKISATATRQTGLKAANGVATIPGKSARTIIINAHADAWFVGADDNGSGLATTLALARYFAKRPKPEHTLVFMISSGHHSPGRGIPEFRKVHEKDYVANMDLMLNMEHVGQSGFIRSMAETQTGTFGRWKTDSTTANWPVQVGVTNQAPYLIDLWRQASACFGINTQRVVDDIAPGEPGAYNDLKKTVPLTAMISVGPLYHTTGEVLDTVPQEGLERAARFHAYFIDAVDKAPGALLKGAPWPTPIKKCPATP